MKRRTRAHLATAETTSSPAESHAEATRHPGKRLAYGVVIAWIVGWFGFLLVQGICPVP